MTFLNPILAGVGLACVALLVGVPRRMARRERIAWGARLTVVGVISTMAPGCGVHQTPDGFRFRTGNTVAMVQDKLGPPDLIHDRVAWDGYPWTHHYYLDRGYVVGFRKGYLRGVTVIDDPTGMADLRREVQVLREVVPLVPAGSSILAVEEHFGTPAIVEEQWKEDGFNYCRSLKYDDLLSRSSPPKLVICYYPSSDIWVRFDDGRVQEAKPISRSAWNQLFQRDPPALSAAKDSANKP